MQSLLVNQRRRQGDPTGTGGIRRRYEADLNRRYTALRRLIRQSVVANDAFGLREAPRVFQPIPSRAFAFPTDPAKIVAFERWLRQQIDEGILEVITRNPDGTVEAATGWQDTYVRAAYGKGVSDAQASLTRQGVALPEIELQTLLQGPVHVPRLETLFLRNFTELQGITASMSQTMSRVLAEGLSRGDGPEAIARALTRELEINRNRARLLARTETIRAHAEGTLTELQRQGVTEVRPDVEFTTAGDIRVCPQCLLLESTDQFGLGPGVYPIDRARGVIPVHVRCRCSWVPANFVGQRDDGGARARRVAQSRQRRQALLTSPAARREQREASQRSTRRRPRRQGVVA